MRTRARVSARAGEALSGTFASFVDGGLDLVDQRGEVGNALGDSGELRQFSSERSDLILCVSGGSQEDGDFEDVRRRQDGAS